MGAIATIAAPIYLMIGVGYLAARFGALGKSDTDAIARLVLRLCLPIAIFASLVEIPVGQILRADFFSAYLAGSLVTFAIAYRLARVSGADKSGAATEAYGASSANTAFIGFPLVLSAVGPVAYPALALAVLVQNVAILPLATALAGSAAQSGVVRGLVRNPLILSVLAGIGASASGVILPTFLGKALSEIASVSAPVALIAIGAMAATMSRGQFDLATARVTAAKLVLHPAAVFLGFVVLLPAVGVAEAPPPLVAAGVLNAAVPMVTIFGLLGAQWGYPQVAASSLLVSIPASVFTVSILVWWLGFTG